MSYMPYTYLIIRRIINRKNSVRRRRVEGTVGRSIHGS